MDTGVICRDHKIIWNISQIPANDNFYKYLKAEVLFSSFQPSPSQTIVSSMYSVVFQETKKNSSKMSVSASVSCHWLKLSVLFYKHLITKTN